MSSLLRPSFSAVRTSIAIRRIVPSRTFVTMNSASGFVVNKALDTISRDFRSDTLTVPTDPMLDLMKEASRGDDVYKEDETTNNFQDRVAQMTGKQAGLFCVSGTMTNQLAIRSHLTQPPFSVLCDARAHVHMNEAGGIAHHSQATTIPVYPKNGVYLTLEDVVPNLILGDDIHRAPTKLVCLENTLNGTIIPQEEIVRISQKLKELGIPLHLDGARIWDAAAATNKTIKEICEPFDSVSLCMSKGLGAPIGSVLVGTSDLIKRANWFRKMFGGGIRQCGGLAAAANYTLDHHFPQLPKVHSLARKLAIALHELGFNVILPVQTGMVFIDPQFIGVSLQELQDRLSDEHDIRVGLGKYPRIVLHFQIKDETVDQFIQVATKLVKEKGGASLPEPSHPRRQLSAAYSQGQVPPPTSKADDDIVLRGY